MAKPIFKFELGVTAKDIITGFTGIVSARTQYQTGCCTYGLASRKLSTDGKPVDWEWFDEVRLEIVDAKPIKLGEEVDPGGPCDSSQIAPQR